MIKFETIRWKNFLSTGDNFTEIRLNTSGFTLITGKNGGGKSTLIDALVFSLFGKPHRNISKPMLINSVNGRDCIVELNFKIGSVDFKIVRGIKPSIFEIYQNGQLINQDSSSRDYQKYLEKNILKMDYKSFHQIVVLGSSSFIPFMQLPTGKRREIVENILDIDVFSKMNIVLKQRLAELKANIDKIENGLELISSKIETQQKYIKRVKSNSKEQLDSSNIKLSKLIDDKFKVEEEIDNYQSKIDSLNFKSVMESISSCEKKIKELSKFESKFETSIANAEKMKQFFSTNSKCPTCDQEIDKVIAETKWDQYDLEIKSIQENLNNAKLTASNIQSQLKGFLDIKSQVDSLETSKTLSNHSRKQIEAQINELVTFISKLSSINEEELESEYAKLDEMIQLKNTMYKRKMELIEDREYYFASAEMLKDTGIKTKIIKEYIPIMNKMINQYLGIMDFFVSFHFDENFNETIKSRHRDSFTYSSFSEGEKSKIDIALLLTWRHIARLKNSTNTNLLVLDETFDSSLDQNSVSCLSDILSSGCAAENVFVISHREQMGEMDGVFRNKITFVKEGNFSKKL